MHTMASSTAMISLEDTTTRLLSSDGTPQQTTASPFNSQDFLEAKNRQFVATLAPTLSYLALVMACGLAGNTLVFVVYYKRFKPSVTRTYVLAMGVCDLMTNVLSVPADIVEVRFHNTFEERWLCRTFRTVKSFLGFLSAFILVAVAFDRQRAICSPQLNSTTVKHAVIVLLVVSAFSVVFTVPYTVLTGPSTVRYEGSNITGLECSIDNMFAQSLFLFIYNVITGLVLVVCICLMLGSYVRIARQLWLHKKNTAIIMNTAADQDRRKTSDQHSHTYTFEESSSSRTRGSSARSQKTAEARNDPPQTAIELSHQGTPLHDNTSKEQGAESVLNQVEDPTAVSSSLSKEHVDSPSPQTTTSDSTVTDCNKLVTSSENRQFGNEAGQPNVSDITTSEVKVHNNGRNTSDPKKSARVSSYSRSVLSRIRQRASDASAFLSRKKPTSKRRGSVRKIPTRTTFMMFVLTIIFIINYLPYLALVSVRSRSGVAPLVGVMGINGYHIGLRSYFLNSAVNPLVYSFCSAKFRQECRRLFIYKRT